VVCGGGGERFKAPSSDLIRLATGVGFGKS
jgi:hypothetical protein